MKRYPFLDLNLLIAIDFQAPAQRKNNADTLYRSLIVMFPAMAYRLRRSNLTQLSMEVAMKICTGFMPLLVYP
jgi:hypothetical protein